MNYIYFTVFGAEKRMRSYLCNPAYLRISETPYSAMENAVNFTLSCYILTPVISLGLIIATVGELYLGSLQVSHHPAILACVSLFNKDIFMCMCSFQPPFLVTGYKLDCNRNLLSNLVFIRYLRFLLRPGINFFAMI